MAIPLQLLRSPSAAAARQPLRVGFLLLDNFTLTAFSGLIDALRLAADHGARSRQIDATWTVMSPDSKPRQSSCGVAVSPNAGLLDPAGFDYIAVCGGNDYTDWTLSKALLDYLQRAAGQRTRLLGICTGTFAIAKAGLVGDRRVCIHWNVADAFAAQFPAITALVDGLFIDEGDLITCAGSTAAIDLALYLITRHCGRGHAQQALRHMMLQDIRPPTAPQAHFYANLDGVSDLRVRQAMNFIEQRLDTPPAVAAVARYVGVSARQLERIFSAAIGIGPAGFQRRMRMDYAAWLLRNSNRSVTQIALDAGFADAAHFSRDFRTRHGRTPRAFRVGMGEALPQLVAGETPHARTYSAG
jgi:transcriptional regulator GlxA family with amidase domain